MHEVTGSGGVRVLRVIARLNVGGPARHVAVLSDLDGNVFDTLVAHGAVGPGETEMTEVIERLGRRRVFVPELGPTVRWRQDLAAFAKLFALCRRFKPQIIHTHTAKAGTLGRLAGAFYSLTSVGRRRCRIVHTFHGHVFEQYFGATASRVVRIWERVLGLITDRIVVLSQQQYQDIVERFAIAPSSKVVVVPLGLDLESLSLEGQAPIREMLRRPLDVPVIGIVGRLVPVKNHELFLQAARRLRDRDVPAQFVIVGGGDRERALRQLVTTLGLERDVTFLGWRTDLADIYRSIDIVTLTSRNEGTPVALIEAMAMERAVLATRIGGVQDVVEHERTGLLVDSDDVEALTAGMARLVGDADLRRRLGQAARQSVLRRFSKDRLTEDIAAMYRQLVEQA